MKRVLASVLDDIQETEYPGLTTRISGRYAYTYVFIDSCGKVYASKGLPEVYRGMYIIEEHHDVVLIMNLLINFKTNMNKFVYEILHEQS